MNYFEHNVLKIDRERGAAWLANLPNQVESVANLWGLDHLKPFDNLSYNYVLEGEEKGNPIVLKLSLDPFSLEKEAKALKAFAGYGVVKVLGYKEGALLIEKAVPGTSLKNGVPKKRGLQIAADVMKKLHQAPLPQKGLFPHIREQLEALDWDWNIPHFHLEWARKLKKQLLRIEVDSVLLHGDLHRGNILSNGNGWVVIDPKGVIGAPIHEVWAFVEDPKTDLLFISDYFHFEFDEVVKWYYVHLVLAACWQLEDHLDPKLFLDLADSVYGMTRSLTT